MFKPILIALLPFLFLFNSGSDALLSGAKPKPDGYSGTLEKMLVESGTVSMRVDLSKINANAGIVQIDMPVKANSFFTILVFNNELRGPNAGSMDLEGSFSGGKGRSAISFNDLALENQAWEDGGDLVVRSATTGAVYFRVEGQEYTYNPMIRGLVVSNGRLVVTDSFAASLGRKDLAGITVGTLGMETRMRTIESSVIVDGEVKSEDMPTMAPGAGTVPGPDVIVGDLSGLAQFGGSDGTQVGLAVATDSCNFGTENLHWNANPSNDHPVIPQNLYRMSASGDRMEQIGQSSVKHAFTALTMNICGLGCNGVGGSNLGSGCSDPYSASLNSGPNLGSRAWINPFTGAFPRNDSATPNNSHTGHSHTGTSHRILVEMNDLNTSMNAGATYYAEGQYITPHEYAWCQTHPGQCNMYNNVSYRQYSVNGTSSPFSFSPVASTVRTKPAIMAWTGATMVDIQPAAGTDGVGTVAYKVTNVSPGVWHYEYAIYNQNMDRGIQSFSVPVSSGDITNIGFHAPPQHPGWANDGTLANAGFSSQPWAVDQSGGNLTWSSETFAQNVNANAIRWGTTYNFRFDSTHAPVTATATIGFYKTGEPITVNVQAPASVAPPSTFTVAGRVVNSSGMGVGMERVFLSGSVTRAGALTNPFGYFFFSNVTAGDYTIGVASRRYTYPSSQITVSDNISDLLITANP
ncbi:MAG: carboxypeptidase regulatory-like domain-containing protein [Acidobacteria bacterium]|nr:carboxypeptidase regulatory-like domain-containing protein [Acidobacteriota bacterium]